MSIFQNGKFFINRKKKAQPGQFSIFTACRDRIKNLTKALPNWLTHDEIGEVVIVDWSAEVPVAKSIARQLRDERVKLIRVEGETHWINTLAFNLAARHTSKQYLLRVDADVLIKRKFFRAHRFDDTWYMTGNPKDDKSLTGLLYVHRDHFFAINGYNEFLRSYGWEDRDIFARLLLERNLRHRYFKSNSARHMPHSDAERTRQQFQGHLTYSPGDLLQDAITVLEKHISKLPGLTYESRIKSLEYLCNNGSPVDELIKMITDATGFHNMKNRYLAGEIPWGPQYQQAQYEKQSADNDKVLLLRRSGAIESIPESLIKKAELYAFVKLFSWRCDQFLCPLNEFELDAVANQQLRQTASAG